MRMTIPILLLLAACGGEEATKGEPRSQLPPAPVEWKMSASPDTPYSVADAKEELPEEEIVVEGRVRSLVKGRAVFLLTDDKLEYCGEVNKEDTCKTPWDYCCDPQDEVNALTLTVQFEDENGTPVKAAWGSELRHCDLVQVRGKVTKDERGNVTIHARRYHRKERPELPDYVTFP